MEPSKNTLWTVLTIILIITPTLAISHYISTEPLDTDSNVWHVGDNITAPFFNSSYGYNSTAWDIAYEYAEQNYTLYSEYCGYAENGTYYYDYVPYTGAMNNTDLGNYNISANTFCFTPDCNVKMYYNNTMLVIE